jgi:hypothetical protein
MTICDAPGIWVLSFRLNFTRGYPANGIDSSPVHYNSETFPSLIEGGKLRPVCSFDFLAKLIRHDLRELMIRRGLEYFEDLKKIHESFPFSMVVSDLGFTGIPFINRLMQIPVIALGLHPLKESSVLLPPYGTGETPASSRLSRLRVGIQRFIQENFTHRNLSILQQRMHYPYGIRGTGHVHDDMISHILESRIVVSSLVIR